MNRGSLKRRIARLEAPRAGGGRWRDLDYWTHEELDALLGIGRKPTARQLERIVAGLPLHDEQPESLPLVTNTTTNRSFS